MAIVWRPQFLTMQASLQSCLWRGSWLLLEQVSRKRKKENGQDGRLNLFCLTLEVTYHYSAIVYCSHRPNLVRGWSRIYKDVNTREWGSLGGHLRGWLPQGDSILNPFALRQWTRLLVSQFRHCRILRLWTKKFFVVLHPTRAER